jgi:hypothetical protein
MSGHRADGVGVVVDIRDAGIAGPSVGLGGRSCGDIGLDEGVQACGGEVSDRRQSDPAGGITHDLGGAGEKHLAFGAAATAADNGVVVSSTSTIPVKGLRLGATIARRSLALSSQAVL